jgi:SAM-dependent methyltransferase
MAPPAEQLTFYDHHPFDWAITKGLPDIHSVVSPMLARLIETLDAKSLILDVGCGPGRVLGFLAQRGLRCVGVDRSRVSLELATGRYGRPGVVADNLRLPIRDEIADFIISDGVVHHTEDPRASLIENLRILKPGGLMYLGVYKPSGRYPLLYNFPGALIRDGLRRAWSRPLVTVFGQVPYFLFHYLQSRGRRTWAGSLNLFYDYFVTPRVAFLGRETIEAWCASDGAAVLQYDENGRSNVHSFLIKKGPVSRDLPNGSSSRDPESVLTKGNKAE